MDKITFYKEGFVAAAERMICAEAECRQFLQKMMQEKAAYLVRKIKDNTYGKDDLIGKDEYDWKHFREGTYKAVHVEAEVTHGMMAGMVDSESYYANRVASITVYFMLNPGEVLDDKSLKLTEGEKKLLKQMKRMYDNGRFRSNGDGKELEKKNNDLWYLKNNLKMVHDLTWTYDFDRIMYDGFVNAGLKAAKTII